MEPGDATVRVLGPVQIVRAEGGVVDLPSASQRRLLAALALHAPAPVRAEWLCAILDVSPGALRTSISRMRRVLGGGGVQTTVGGCRLDAPVDAALARDEIEAAKRDPEMLSSALARWAGPALAEFADESRAMADAARLAEVRASAVVACFATTRPARPCGDARMTRAGSYSRHRQVRTRGHPNEPRRRPMFVTVIHKIHDPEGFQKAEEKALEAGLPSHVALPIHAATNDHKLGICIWEGESVDAVREVVEGAVGAWADNEYYEVHVDGLTPQLTK